MPRLVLVVHLRVSSVPIKQSHSILSSSNNLPLFLMNSKQLSSSSRQYLVNSFSSQVLNIMFSSIQVILFLFQPPSSFIQTQFSPFTFLHCLNSISIHLTFYLINFWSIWSLHFRKFGKGGKSSFSFRSLFFSNFDFVINHSRVGTVQVLSIGLSN